ncbi:hypothetical protein K4K56_007057 [Colletotrichum sp. SAR 10_98]|nr:hypothetical protein K4K56_007057 [Colletotrichum sp. SAR 10_98]
MKFIVHTVFSLWVGIASAGVIDLAATEVDVATSHPVGRLWWYGAVSEGGPVVYYEGEDLNDINSQISAEHPNLSLYDGTMDFSDNTTAVGIPDGASFTSTEVVRLDERALEARDDTVHSTKQN